MPCPPLFTLLKLPAGLFLACFIRQNWLHYWCYSIEASQYLQFVLSSREKMRNCLPPAPPDLRLSILALCTKHLLSSVEFSTYLTRKIFAPSIFPVSSSGFIAFLVISMDIYSLKPQEYVENVVRCTIYIAPIFLTVISTSLKC